MKGFVLGILLTLAVVIVGGIFVAETGRVDMRADIPIPEMEAHFAGGAMDASVDRHAPNVTNPLQPTSENLIGGATVYLDHCALCHGDPARPKALLADALNPRAPQFMTDAPDMPENQNYYITGHGVRWTAMPAWKNVLSDKDIWQVVTFLSHMNNLPPEVKTVFGLVDPSKRTDSKSGSQ